MPSEQRILELLTEHFKGHIIRGFLKSPHGITLTAESPVEQMSSITFSAEQTVTFVGTQVSAKASVNVATLPPINFEM